MCITSSVLLLIAIRESTTVSIKISIKKIIRRGILLLIWRNELLINWFFISKNSAQHTNHPKTKQNYLGALETEKSKQTLKVSQKLKQETSRERTPCLLIYLYIYFAALLWDQTIAAAGKTSIGKQTLFVAAWNQGRNLKYRRVTRI